MTAPAITLTNAAQEATNLDQGPLSPWGSRASAPGREEPRESGTQRQQSAAERGAEGGVRSADALAFAPGTPLKEQAWALYCQGAHSPEIGRRLGISERTVRSWLSRTLNDLDAEHTALRAHELALAIARKRQLSAAAWESYSRLSATADAECAKAADGDPTANVRLVRQALSAGARYLALANAIDRDLVRLSDIGHSGMSEPRQRSASPLPFREGGQGVRLEAVADRHDDPPGAASLLDLLTPDVLARMAADGLLDDWPASPATDADQDSSENATAAKTANPLPPAPAAAPEAPVMPQVTIHSRTKHATPATSATSATPATSATSATPATSATSATPATSATSATPATSATSATSAISATISGERGAQRQQDIAMTWEQPIMENSGNFGNSSRTYQVCS